MITIHDFYKFFLIFGQGGGAVAIGPIGPIGPMGCDRRRPCAAWQRMGSMVVALRERRLAGWWCRCLRDYKRRCNSQPLVGLGKCPPLVIGFALGEVCDACIAGGRCAAPDWRLSAAVALREQRAGMGRMGCDRRRPCAALAAHGEHGGVAACAITRGDVIRYPARGCSCA